MIKRQDIEKSRVAGSPKPKRWTVVLARPQLLDLIRYLTDPAKIR